jgi:hypothetical protein
MPVVHRYKNGRGFYIKANQGGRITTYQVSSSGATVLKAQGHRDGSSLSPAELMRLRDQGLVTTGGSGPGEIEPTVPVQPSHPTQATTRNKPKLSRRERKRQREQSRSGSSYSVSPPAQSPSPLPPVYIPEPAPVYIPEPAPVYIPEPAPVYTPEPAPVYIPEPAPVYIPEPAPVYIPEPAPVYIPEPAPVSWPFPSSANTLLGSPSEIGTSPLPSDDTQVDNGSIVPCHYTAETPSVPPPAPYYPSDSKSPSRPPVRRRPSSKDVDDLPAKSQRKQTRPQKNHRQSEQTTQALAPRSTSRAIDTPLSGKPAAKSWLPAIIAVLVVIPVWLIVFGFLALLLMPKDATPTLKIVIGTVVVGTALGAGLLVYRSEE